MTIYQNHDPNIHVAFELAPDGAVIVPVAAWRIRRGSLVPMVVTDRGLIELSAPLLREHASEYYAGSTSSYLGVFGLDRRADKDFLLYLALDHALTGVLEAVRGHMIDPLITVAEAEEVARRHYESLFQEA